MRKTGWLVRMLLAVMVAAMLISSCARSDDMRRLVAIEALLDDSPELVQASLDSIDAKTLKGEALALYAVLKTQADYKCYADIASDSLIRTATDWYGIERKGYRAAMSWYSLGCVSKESGDERTALDATLKAMALFPDTTVRYYAFCLQSLGRIYLSRMMFDEADDVLTRCASHPYCVNGGKSYLRATYDLGLCALYSERFERADSIFGILRDIQNLPEYYKTELLLQQAKIELFGNDDCDRALLFADEYLSMLDNPASWGAGLSLKGDAFYASGTLDSAYHYYKESMECDDELYTVCSNADRLSELAAMLGNEDEAASYHNLYVELRDSIEVRERAVEMAEVESEYQLSSQAAELQARHQRFILLCVALLITFALLLILAYITKKRSEEQRIIRKQEEIRQSTIDVLELKVRELSEQDPGARHALLDLYARRLLACRSNFVSTPAFSMLSAAKSGKGVLTQQDRSTIIEEMRHSFTEAIQDFYAEVPNAGGDDAMTMLLTYLNCSNELIADICNVTGGAISKRKYRLSQKASEDFLNLFA